MIAFALLGVGSANAVRAGEPASRESPDAVIEKWHQSWVQNDDGSVVYHEIKHVRLNNDRAYGEFADPRITFNSETDKVEVITARVQRPDGRYVEVPKYSRNEVSPFDSAGWPAFAGIRQIVYTMSGIEPGCVVELEYKITSKPGARPCLAGDVRLDHRYPVNSRKVAVYAWPKHSFNMHASGLQANESEPSSVREQTATHDIRIPTIELHNLGAAPDESQCVAWQERCRRITFSTAEGLDMWLTSTIGGLESAADRSELVKSLATKWTKDAASPEEKIRAIQQKLTSTFNYVDFEQAWQPAQIRPTSTVLNTNYGVPREATAVLLALARAAGLTAQPAVLVNDTIWDDKTPQEADVAAYVVNVTTPTGMQAWHAQHGRIADRGRWGGHAILTLADGKCKRTEIPHWNNPDDSRCSINGMIALADNGAYSGKITIRSSGVFVSSESLRSADGQRSRAEALLHRVLPDAKVGAVSVRQLTPGTFDADVEIAASGPAEKLEGAFRLALAQDGPGLSDVSMPLTSSRRTLPVRITAPFNEQIDLAVDWPAGWKKEASPPSLSKVSGKWGALEQSVTPRERGLTLTRSIRIEQRDISAEDFLTLRKPMNELRSEYARTLLLKP